MALGQTSGSVLRGVLRSGLAVTFTGTAVGLGFTALIGEGMREDHPCIDPYNPVLFGGVALTLAMVSVVAGWIPPRVRPPSTPLSPCAKNSQAPPRSERWEF